MNLQDLGWGIFEGCSNPLRAVITSIPYLQPSNLIHKIPIRNRRLDYLLRTVEAPTVTETAKTTAHRAVRAVFTHKWFSWSCRFWVGFHSVRNGLMGQHERRR